MRLIRINPIISIIHGLAPSKIEITQLLLADKELLFLLSTDKIKSLEQASVFSETCKDVQKRKNILALANRY